MIEQKTKAMVQAIMDDPVLKELSQAKERILRCSPIQIRLNSGTVKMESSENGMMLIDEIDNLISQRKLQIINFYENL